MPVDLWAVGLDVTPDVVAAYGELLSPDERERAARFRFDHLRRRFTVARGVLRVLLASYTGRAAREIVFRYAEGGKPSVAGGPHFNLAHAGEVAVYAFCAASEVGVDVEPVRPIEELDAIAAQFFAPQEHAELESLHEHERTEAFFHCWTRKEAYIKASGRGLAEPLDRFVVSVHPSARPAIRSIEGHPQAAAHWLLHPFTPAPGYVATLAVPTPLSVNEVRRVDAAELLRP